MNISELKDVIRTELSEVHTCLPGVIVSYDGTRAVVAPSLPKQLANGDVLPAPQIVSVPVCFPNAAGGSAMITVPLAAGDPVMLNFCERALENWLSGSDSAPDDPRQFDLTDAFATPLMRNTAADTENVVVQYGSGTLKIAPNGDLTITVPNMHVVASNTVFDSPVVVNGPLTYTAGLNGEGGAGSTFTVNGNSVFNGNVATNGGLENNGVNVGSDHAHTGVTAGGDTTGAPEQ